MVLLPTFRGHSQSPEKPFDQKMSYERSLFFFENGGEEISFFVVFSAMFFLVLFAAFRFLPMGNGVRPL